MIAFSNVYRSNVWDVLSLQGAGVDGLRTPGMPGLCAVCLRV